jgi:hypothetical protein
MTASDLLLKLFLSLAWSLRSGMPNGYHPGKVRKFVAARPAHWGLPVARTCVAGLLTLLLASIPDATRAAEWPTRSVTVIVPYVAGGNTDMMARLAWTCPCRKSNPNILMV